MRKIKYLIICSFLSLLFSNDFENAVSFYDNRADESNGVKANPGNIDKAIELFSKSLESKGFELESAIYLIKSGALSQGFTF